MTERSFPELKKAARSARKEECVGRLVVMGNCATQHAATALRGMSVLEGCPLWVTDIDYDLIDAQILDENSELYRAAPEYVLLFLSTERLHEDYEACADKPHFAEAYLAAIEGYWQAITARMRTTILQFTFLEEDDRVFGNYALKCPSSFLFQVKKLNLLLAERSQQAANVLWIDLNSLALRAGKPLRDDRLYHIGKLSIAPELLPCVARQVINVIQTARGRIRKCVICDLDNTLWGGIIGDDGLQGIQIGELGTGHAFDALQRWLKQLKDRGILLGVCSKNDEANAREPFLKHPDMRLRLEDFAIFVANWENKADNLRFIQQTLNIGFDSMVFLDDNPFERSLVRSTLPDIAVPELPEDPAMWLSYLKGLDLFETVSYSDADSQRTEQYRAESSRAQAIRQFPSYDAYLQSLDMVAEAKPFDEFHVPRIAQLTQRSNQFNLRTVRCTEGDIYALMCDEKYITRYFTLRDRFGDHGLVSVVALRHTDERTLFIENWMMSCRVLKRGMEEFILNEIHAIALENGCDTVIGEYLPTPKNAMVADFYPNHGFEAMNDGRYQMAVAAWKPLVTWIRSEKTREVNA